MENRYPSCRLTRPGAPGRQPAQCDPLAVAQEVLVAIGETAILLTPPLHPY